MTKRVPQSRLADAAEAAAAAHGWNWVALFDIPHGTKEVWAVKRLVYRALRETGAGLLQIEAFVGRDHSTVLNGLRPKRRGKS